jgi:outer membrane receptor protein involved in Fe transport
VLAACLALGLAAPLWAQGAGASIVGTVKDEQGGVLPGCTVTLRSQDTGLTRSAVTDANGRYQFLALPLGRYSVKAELTGFTTANATDLTLTIGLELRRDFTMSIRAVEENVTVSAVAPTVDVSKSEVAGVVSQEQIQTLPVNSRQYLNLALLMPGTSQDAARPFYNNVTISAGGTFYSNGFLVDGMSNTWAEEGEPRQNFPQSAVQEFKVHTIGFPAEFGLAVGGLVQVVTKSGSNNFSGDGFWYYRGKNLNTLNKFEEQNQQQTGAPKPDFRRNQFGGSAGGPIVHDRTHFFAAFERTVTDNFYTVNTGRPDLYGSLEGTFKAADHTNLYDFRVDHQINRDQSLFVRYAQEDELTSCHGCGGFNASNAGFDFGKPARSLVAGHTWIISPEILNEARFQFGYTMYQVFPAGSEQFTDVGSYPPARIGPQRNNVVLSLPSLTYGNNFDELGPEKRWQIKDSVSWNRGLHGLKFGFDFSYIPFIDDAVYNLNGTYTFAQDQPLNPNVPSTIANLKNPVLFTASVPPINNSIPTKHFAAYIQDEWRPRSNVSLNLGLRYDRQFGSFNENLDPNSFNPRLPFIDPSIRGDKNNFGPRIGLTWDVKGDAKNVVRAGYGIYYDNIRTLNNFPEVRNLQQFSIVITNPSYPDPYGGKDPVTFASTAPPNLFILANDFRNPKAQQFNVGFSRQLTSDLSLHVDGSYVRMDGDRIQVDLNPADPVTGIRPMPQWGQINQDQSIVWSHYEAMYVRLDKRLTHRTQYLISYTLAHQTDFASPQSAGGRGFGKVTDQSNYGLDQGDSDADRRHTLVASGAVLLPYDFVVGAVWTYRSTLPFSALSGTFGVDGQPLYVPGTSRNQGNRDLNLSLVNAWRAQNGLGPIPASQIDKNDFNSFDIRGSKAFPIGRTKLELIAQVFNVFGRDNLSAPLQGNTGQVLNALSNSFGQILSAGPRQQGELAIRVSW